MMRVAVAEDREREMSDQMDWLLCRVEGLRRSASRGVPLGPLVGADAAVGRSFRRDAERSLRALLDRASWIL